MDQDVSLKPLQDKETDKHLKLYELLKLQYGTFAHIGASNQSSPHTGLWVVMLWTNITILKIVFKKLHMHL